MDPHPFGGRFGPGGVPDYLPLRIVPARMLLRLNRVDEGIRDLDAVLSLSRDRLALAAFGVAYARAGEVARAGELMDELEAIGDPRGVANLQAASGDLDAAFETARRAVDAGQGAMSFVRINTD